ncbi:DegT/DnrJ/EryC1/StrS family aminotransferase [Thermodesulfovibrio thiophilus]|uniref:DegT/DnrJ/EryC1/StrS family aminotransferase n=1 Tax=Thermodesulfovibrio thiophilus TaxID=340095 RepID=UPI001838D77A|nr:DegT/DnrJ/EryC1/StrS family aminotransferase [Thermodesulfovibrio thiophilus]HHW20267.1 DegT/DnrJ/EryC1/StrS family aminotransferase [Thermodesulfovibrio thiophilus]
MNSVSTNTVEKKIPLLDLHRGFEPLEKEIKEEWDNILKSMKLLNGNNLKKFEESFSNYLGVRYAYGVSSGTASLMLGVIAINIGSGDEVILHPNCFMAAVEAIKIAGAKPVLVDTEKEGFGPDPDQIEKTISEKTKAILIVHMYGHPINVTPILDICNKHGLKLIEDCSHAHGAEYKGRKVGSFGHVGCFSCGIVKNLNAYGDAGVVVTNDENTAFRLNYLRVHGQVKKNNHVFYGFNSRLDELQAAVLRIKLKYLDEKNARRKEIARRYCEALADIKDITLPQKDEINCRSVYHQFVIRTSQRDSLAAHLKSHGIDTGVHYPIPLHLQTPWKDNNFGTYNLPRAERLAQEILSIPVFPELRDDEIDYIIESIKEFFK